MGLMASWGFGGELVVRVGDAIANMRRASVQSKELRKDFNQIKGDAKAAGVEIAGVRSALAPLGVEFGAVSARAEGLTNRLEANRRELANVSAEVARTERELDRADNTGGRFAGTLERMRGGVGTLVSGLGQIGLVLAPVGLLFSGVVAQSSSLASDLEANRLTMRVLVGDAAKSEELITRIRKNAAETPFETGELIDTSKRLLNLTGDNIDRNMELLQLTETMAGLNPTKTVVDAAEALLDATSGGGFERLKEFPGLTLRASMFEGAGEAGGKAWGDAIVAELQKRVAEKTHGENLVGALAETMKGRLSTLSDAVSTALTDLGTKLNERGKGWVIALTDGINAAAPTFRAAFVEFFGSAGDAVQATIGPWLEQLRAWWTGLGEDGQKQIMKWVIGIGAFATAATTLGAALGVVGLLGSGVVSVFSGLWTIGSALVPLLTGAGGTIATAWGGIVGLMQGGIAGLFTFIGAIPSIAAVIAGLFVVAIAGAEGFWDWIAAVGTAIWDLGTTVIGGLWNAVSSFFGGFLEGLQSAGDTILSAVGQPVLDLLGTLRELFGYLLPATDQASEGWATFGRWVGYAFGWVMKLVGGVLRAVVVLVDGALSIFKPFFQAIGLLGKAIGGLITGSMTGAEVFQVLLSAFVAWIGGIGTGIVAIVATVLETVINLIGTALQAIPGVGDALSGYVFGGATAIGDFRRDMQRQFAEAVDRGAATAADRDAAKADSAATVQVDLGTSPIEVEVYPTSTVEIDGKEVARSQGRQAAKASDRGTGPKLPAEQRARVLRRGLEVTPLRPAEV